MFGSEYPLRRQRMLGEGLFPFGRSFQRAVDSLMREVGERPITSSLSEFAPQIDVDEDDHEIRVYAELPGLTESDVEIIVEPNTLTLRGEKKEERRKGEKGWSRFVERSYGAFERTIPLRAGIDESKIQANFERGVLTVCLPKTEQARSQARRIPIQTGTQSKQLEESGKTART
jgi:HSP20 family protein